MNRKVTVVGGAGNVGATVARGVAEKQLADVVVIDIADQKAAGVALDMLEACPIYGSDSRVLGTGDYAESANSDIVVVTSGVPRKPGMSRDDLLNVNYKIMQQVTEQVVKHSPNCIIIPVSNPLAPPLVSPAIAIGPEFVKLMLPASSASPFVFSAVSVTVPVTAFPD